VIEGRRLPDRIYTPPKPPKPRKARAGKGKGKGKGASVKAFAAGFASNTVGGAADIDELARALKNNVDLIYEHVFNNVEWLPTYGSQKGAYGCLVDGLGNSFDQSELMIELLREAGYTADFMLGELELTPAQAADWFGTDANNVWSSANYLSDGGIPKTPASA
jgi:hypothetical protein